MNADQLTALGNGLFNRIAAAKNLRRRAFNLEEAFPSDDRVQGCFKLLFPKRLQSATPKKAGRPGEMATHEAHQKTNPTPQTGSRGKPDLSDAHNHQSPVVCLSVTTLRKQRSQHHHSLEQLGPHIVHGLLAKSLFR